MSSTESPSKVAFFSHFPHYFLKPYAGQLRYDTNHDVFSALSSKNCEWFLRPNVALSETAQAITDNLEILRNSSIFDPAINTHILDKFHPTLLESLDAINTRVRTTSPEPHHIFNLLDFAAEEDQEMDALLAEAMQSAAALLCFTSHLRVLRELVCQTETVAEKLQSQNPACVVFKQQRTLTAFQQMLNTLCTSGYRMAAPGARRNLQSQLTQPARAAPPSRGLLQAQLTQPARAAPPSRGLLQPPPSLPSQNLAAPPNPTLPQQTATHARTLPPQPVPSMPAQPVPSMPPQPIPSTSGIPQAMMDMLVNMQAQMDRLQQQQQQTQQQLPQTPTRTRRRRPQLELTPTPQLPPQTSTSYEDFDDDDQVPLSHTKPKLATLECLLSDDEQKTPPPPTEEEIPKKKKKKSSQPEETTPKKKKK